MRILVGPQRDAEKMRLSMESAFKAAQELYDDTLEIVQQRRANGSVGNDLIGYLLRANDDGRMLDDAKITRSEEHTSELQSLMRISYAVLCLKKTQQNTSN